MEKEGRKELKKLRTTIEKFLTESERELIAFEVLDAMPLIFWIKKYDFSMHYCTKQYEEVYLTPRGFAREEYYESGDFKI